MPGWKSQGFGDCGGQKNWCLGFRVPGLGFCLKLLNVWSRILSSFFYRLGSEDLGGMLQFGLKHRLGGLFGVSDLRGSACWFMVCGCGLLNPKP